MTPEMLALLAVACLVPPAETPLPDPALTAALAALRPSHVASPPAPAEVTAAFAAAAQVRRRRHAR
ncbi:hypothetical protein [Methylorubrum salsuginis]|uniref:Uncharacterized protein n=1 Tax=Methylorubrum salsuginis TaxID=414703 RepID=A0A1I4MJ10_9HYPH|nr:hypothetical protein [Methylorubrum salsuginis]SFM03432.1 hypothetical protein SAMN04488125_13930 [Methylorubrum salsuginis]